MYDEPVSENTVGGGNRARVAQQRHRQQAVRLCAPLPSDKGHDPKHARDDRSQGGDRGPLVLRAAPRDADEQAGHAAHEQERAHPVHPPESLRQRQLWLVGVGTDEEQRSDESGEAEGVIYVEALAPGGALHERPTMSATSRIDEPLG
jgi:hypothetical protein